MGVSEESRMAVSSTSPKKAVATATDVLGPWFRTLARSVQTGVVLVDSDGKPTFSNEAANELLGLPSAEDAEALRQLEAALPADLRGACGAESAVLEVEIDPPTGKRSLLLRTLPIKGPGEGPGCGSLILVEDRTKMAALEASLVLASRVQARGFLRAHVHDLKAPLNALALNVELLRKSLEEEDDDADGVQESRVETANVLQREIRRLGRSLDFFLRQATGSEKRRKSGRLDVRRPLRETVRLVRESAKTVGVTLESTLPKAATHVTADEDLLKQVLLNIVLNALEAQPDGGAIRLSAERVGAEVLVRVEDDGPGIPESRIGKVFEMNFSTKERGTGIGLTVAQSLVEALGGRLALSSRPGEGTTIDIHLPASSP